MSDEEGKIKISKGNLSDICSGGPNIFIDDDDDDDDDGDCDSWKEIDIKTEETTCLFCSLQFRTVAVALYHCKAQHNFDILELKKKYNMDIYSYLKMINYIRLHKPDPESLTETTIALWENEENMKPVKMETWLMYDFDELSRASPTPRYVYSAKRTMNYSTFCELQHEIEDLNMQLEYKDTLLEDCERKMAKMKKVVRKIVESGNTYDEKLPQNVLSLNSEGSDYFSSYSHFGIHHEMLNDTVRTESYQQAILKNSNLFEEKVVLDVGCGTGILSLFSARAGAKKVYGVDQSDVVYKAMEIVRENSLNYVIKLIKGQIERTELPVEKVDIIVSEWMGYFLLFEGMLDSFIYARDTYLKKDGLVLPNRCNISIVGVSDIDRYDKIVNYWDDVYGFSMKCMKKEVLKEAFVETVPTEKIVTNPFIIQEIDLKTCNSDSYFFSSKFSLTSLRDCVLTAIVGYFDVFFELENAVEFSTGPHALKTHWQQTVFFLGKTISLKEGDTIAGIITCTRLTKNVRGLSVKITIGVDNYQYILD